MKKTFLMLCLIIVSWQAFAQHNHADHNHSGDKDIKNQKNMVMFTDASITTAYESYLHLKDALVASDQKTATKASLALEQSLKEIKAGKKAKKQAAAISQSASLAAQRKAFTALSNEMSILVKNNDLSMGKIYLDYCPMANSNNGGYWLSSEQDIQNPYFGEMMLKCGSVKETIE